MQFTPLIIERKAFLNSKHFIRFTGTATHLARKNGKILGRSMASDDPNYNSLHQTNVRFGLFSPSMIAMLAAALLTLPPRKKGRTEIRGPIDYSTNYVCAY